MKEFTGTIFMLGLVIGMWVSTLTIQSGDIYSLGLVVSERIKDCEAELPDNTSCHIMTSLIKD